MHYQEERSAQLRTSFLSFSLIFPFDYLGTVPENPGTFIRGIWLSVDPVCRDTTVMHDYGMENTQHVFCRRELSHDFSDGIECTVGGSVVISQCQPHTDKCYLSIQVTKKCWS